jgi:hypothetical protein
MACLKMPLKILFLIRILRTADKHLFEIALRKKGLDEEIALLRVIIVRLYKKDDFPGSVAGIIVILAFPWVWLKKIVRAIFNGAKNLEERNDFRREN